MSFGSGLGSRSGCLFSSMILEPPPLLTGPVLVLLLQHAPHPTSSR